MLRKHSERAKLFNSTHNIGDLMKKSEKWQKALKEGRISGHSKTDDGKKRISEGLKENYKIQKDQGIINRIKDKKKHSEIMTLAIGRKVSQYSKDNTQIESFRSIKEASIKSGVNRKSISHVLAGRSRTAGSFIWKYDTEPKENHVVEEQNQIGSQ